LLRVLLTRIFGLTERSRDRGSRFDGPKRLGWSVQSPMGAGKMIEEKIPAEVWPQLINEVALWVILLLEIGMLIGLLLSL